MKAKKEQRRGRCIFCGEPKVSKAHIWPDWLKKHITDKAKHYLEAVGKFETYTPATKTPKPRTRVRPGDAGSKKVRQVCQRCNSGWLGGLETPAKPIVLSLMNGNGIVLKPDDQLVLARWLCAIGMLLDVADPGGSAVAQTDRNYFMEHCDPPPEWRIWIAKYSGANWQWHRANRTGIHITKSKEVSADHTVCNSQVTTLVLRQLCAHLYSSQVMHGFTGYEGVDLIQLWPQTGHGFFWGNAPRIGDQAVLDLSEALARELPQIT